MVAIAPDVAPAPSALHAVLQRFAPERCDFHLHTRYSDGMDVPEAFVEAAIARGLEAIGFSDHVWRTSSWLDEYIDHIARLKRHYVGRIEILTGVEAKVISDTGQIDIEERYVQRLDYVIGVVHKRISLDGASLCLDQMDPAMSFAIEMERSDQLCRNPLVTVWGHPARSYFKFFRKWQPDFDETFFATIEAAHATGTIVEVNWRVPNAGAVRAFCREHGIAYCCGSDAHSVGELSRGR